MKRFLVLFLVCSLFVTSAAASGVSQEAASPGLDGLHRSTLEAGYDFFTAVLEDGHVVTINDVNVSQNFDVSEWENIVSVSAGVGFIVGLKEDGSVVGTGSSDCFAGIENWTDIVEVACGKAHTVGLRKDGTVVAAGLNDHGQTNVSGWTDITAVAAGSWNTLGIKKDGTVVTVGYNEYGQCNIGSWKDIVDIAGNNWVTVGLKSDGTVVYAGGYDSSDKVKLDRVKRWSDIVSIKAYGDTDVFGIKSDGTILSLNNRTPPNTPCLDVAFSSWHNTAMYLSPDGTLKCTTPQLKDDIEAALQGRKLQIPALTNHLSAATNKPTQDTGVWTMKAYVDEFNLPTNEYYIVNETGFKGTFSNSATTNSVLEAYLFYEGTDKYDILSIRLLEYGDYRVNNPYSLSRDYNIAVMDADGNKSRVTGIMFSDSYDVYVTDEQPILDALKKGGTVRLAITEKEDPLTKYIITIDDAAGFDIAYRQFWEKAA